MINKLLFPSRVGKQNKLLTILMLFTGMFFQWILCSAILLVGMVLQAVRRSTFYPIVMVGGAVWATGQFFSRVIV